MSFCSLSPLQVLLVGVGGLVMVYKLVVEVSRLVRLMLPLLLLIAVLLSTVCAENSDYYTLLGVSREATTREIRQAFKKLALTMHPDKNPVSHPVKETARSVDKALSQHVDVPFKTCI